MLGRHRIQVEDVFVAMDLAVFLEPLEVSIYSRPAMVLYGRQSCFARWNHGQVALRCDQGEMWLTDFDSLTLLGRAGRLKRRLRQRLRVLSFNKLGLLHEGYSSGRLDLHLKVSGSWLIRTRR